MMVHRFMLYDNFFKVKEDVNDEGNHRSLMLLVLTML
jgi:hypothetical protein